MTRVELARHVAKAFGMDDSKIRAATDLEMDSSSKRYPLPPRTCLDVTHTEKVLGRINVGVEEGLEMWKRERSEPIR